MVLVLAVSSRCLINLISSERGPSFKLTNASLEPTEPTFVS